MREAAMLSFLPRKWLQRALYMQWRRSLPRHQRIRLDHWGSAGADAGHHPFQWADEIRPAA
ncbi:MAG: hypothetical protein DI629_12300 [Mesorhizobium amorphae]|nr:MAG: hypothetical protein DI629_12300 [Mesorhizobium amorphae]